MLSAVRTVLGLACIGQREERTDRTGTKIKTGYTEREREGERERERERAREREREREREGKEQRQVGHPNLTYQRFSQVSERLRQHARAGKHFQHIHILSQIESCRGLVLVCVSYSTSEDPVVLQAAYIRHSMRLYV